MQHELKTWPASFAAVVNGSKTHEVRSCTDRDFVIGDTLRLREFDINKGYLGGEIIVCVTYVSRGPDWGLPEYLCVMSIRLA